MGDPRKHTGTRGSGRARTESARDNRPSPRARGRRFRTPGRAAGVWRKRLARWSPGTPARNCRPKLSRGIAPIELIVQAKEIGVGMRQPAGAKILRNGRKLRNYLLFDIVPQIGVVEEETET